MIKLAGVVVLYNPSYDVIDNINSYIDYLEVLIVVDNSEVYEQKLVDYIQRNHKIRYINNKHNVGIAKALNIGAKIAKQEGFHWLLTMDQDSKFAKGMLKIMIDYIESNTNEHVGIIAPYQSVPSEPWKQEQDEYSEVDVVMTSGNILNLLAYESVGEFKEEYFIDYVDVEYCLRLKAKDYRIIKLNNAILEHNLGDFTAMKIGSNKKLLTTNHSPVRRYYITRNRMDVWKLYKEKFPEYISHDKKAAIKEAIKIILMENQKKQKLKNIIKGYIDFKKRRFGSFG